MIQTVFVPVDVLFAVRFTRTRSNSPDPVEPTDAVPVVSVDTAEMFTHNPDPPTDPCICTLIFVDVVTLSNWQYAFSTAVGNDT
jgi:hypothetical protein